MNADPHDGTDEYVDGTDTLSDEEADELEQAPIQEPPPGHQAPRRRRDLQVPPSRRWERVSPTELRRCPKCHAVVPGIKAGFWHLNAVHGGDENDETDVEAWAQDLEDELTELRAAARNAPGRWIHSAPLREDMPSGRGMATVLLAIIALLLAAGAFYYVKQVFG